MGPYKDVLIISQLEAADETIEIVEHKGLGHPDAICDALAENLSRNLCHEYRSRFGEILHYNVDKALLAGGRAMAKFGGGTVLAPIEIYLAGRAISEVGNATLPISEIAIKGSRAWLHANLHALDVERHVRIHNLVRPGSHDLRTPVNLLAGTTILAGTNTYTGGTTINGGTLAGPSASE